MIEIDIKSEIANKEDSIWMEWWGYSEAFSLDLVKRVFEENKEEKDFKFNIHCRGGSVSEGLAIYDYLRTSGKTLYTNIEGSCHSMAIIMLLAAPKENRTANPNSRSIIHQVRAGVCDWATADDLRAIADDVEKDQKAILDIYADRTGYDREKLETIMKEEKERTTSELLEWGFIDKINSYNTNKVITKTNSNMGKLKAELRNKVDSFLNGIEKVLNGVKVNFDFKGENDIILFSTEKEDDTLAVGDNASPDGTFTLTEATSEYPVDTVVVVKDGKIESITEPEGAENNAELEARNAELEAENAELRENLTQSVNLITELKSQIESSYVPKNRSNRVVVPSKKSNSNNPTSEELKDEIRQRREAFTNKGVIARKEN